MPFTFAHPAAVLPIHRKLKKWIALPALVIGSMVPDAAYYLPLPWYYKAHAHTFLGVFTYVLPLSIALLLIFYWIAPEVSGLLPSPYREALGPAAKSLAFSVPGALLAVCGIVIGAETHVLWDSFTHDNGWVVLRVHFLQMRVWTHGPSILGRRGFFIFDALEYISSMVGLCIVLYFCDRWLQTRGMRLWTPPEPSWRLYLWLGIAAASFAEAVIESHTIEIIAARGYLHTRHFMVILLTVFIRNFFLALIVLPIVAKLLRRPPSLRDTAY